MQPPDIIETERLVLRPPTHADAPAIYENYARDPEVTRYVTWQPHKSIADTEEFLRGHLARRQAGTQFTWAITRRTDAQLIGMIEPFVSTYRVGLGYVLARAHWGQGYMTEAVLAVMDWAFAQPHVFRVWAVCDVANRASARVMEKVGMEREGVLRRWSLHPNVSAEPRDCYCYAKVR